MGKTNKKINIENSQKYSPGSRHSCTNSFADSRCKTHGVAGDSGVQRWSSGPVISTHKDVFPGPLETLSVDLERAEESAAETEKQRVPL